MPFGSVKQANQNFEVGFLRSEAISVTTIVATIFGVNDVLGVIYTRENQVSGGVFINRGSIPLASRPLISKRLRITTVNYRNSSRNKSRRNPTKFLSV